jgi:hypothetical protein
MSFDLTFLNVDAVDSMTFKALIFLPGLVFAAVMAGG